jgi:hypothetical protein
VFPVVVHGVRSKPGEMQMRCATELIVRNSLVVVHKSRVLKIADIVSRTIGAVLLAREYCKLGVSER